MEEMQIWESKSQETRTLARRGPVQLAGTAGINEIPGFEDVKPEDLVIPRLYLVQFTSQLGEDLKPGTWWNSLTEEAKPEVNAVLLRLQHTRVWYNPDLGEKLPLCSSDNNIHPRDTLMVYVVNGVPLAAHQMMERYNSAHLGTPRSNWPTFEEWATQFERRMVVDCTTCPFGDLMWGEGVPPLCNLVYTFLGVDRGDGDFPFLVGFRSTSAKAARRMITRLGFAHTPFYAQPITLSSELVQDERGKWYQAKLAVGQPFDKTELSRYIRMYQGLAGVPIEAEQERVGEWEGSGEQGEIPF